MEEKPKIVVSRTRRSEAAPQDFRFTAEMLPKDGVLKEYRRRAFETFRQLPVPTTADEPWRRTDLRPMTAGDFRLAPDLGEAALAAIPEHFLKPIVSDQHGGQIILASGQAQVTLDPKWARQGVIFTDLNHAEREVPDLVRKMAGQTVRVEEGKFAALSGAFSQNGVVLYVPKDLVIDQPLTSLLWGMGENVAHLSHLLVWVDDGASVTYVHEAASPEEKGASMHAGLVEIKVGQGAKLKFVELQSWGRQVWNISHERIQVGRDGELEWIFGAIGSHLTKNFSELDLEGEGARGRMSGFYFTDGDQHLDHDTQQNHLAPHTTSDLLFKGALKGRSHSVWQGMIYVAPGAQKTDGYQANRNLVLNPGAHADSIPGLEILADDVRCTHGATVGKLEQEPLFYLRSRGIAPREAERLMVEGFFDPIMQRIPFEGVRTRFQQAIHEKMAAE